jgi:hypothetical protein
VAGLSVWVLGFVGIMVALGHSYRGNLSNTVCH